MCLWTSGLSRLTFTEKIEGSNPFRHTYGAVVERLQCHLVTVYGGGSNPLGSASRSTPSMECIHEATEAK